jgi:hypothetical protein
MKGDKAIELTKKHSLTYTLYGFEQIFLQFASFFFRTSDANRVF